jgi:hypothetical protein
MGAATEKPSRGQVRPSTHNATPVAVSWPGGSTMANRQVVGENCRDAGRAVPLPGGTLAVRWFPDADVVAVVDEDGTPIS